MSASRYTNEQIDTASEEIYNFSHHGHEPDRSKKNVQAYADLPRHGFSRDQTDEGENAQLSSRRVKVKLSAYVTGIDGKELDA